MDLAARPDSLEQADIELALALSLAEAGMESRAAQLGNMPSGSDNIVQSEFSRQQLSPSSFVVNPSSPTHILHSFEEDMQKAQRVSFMAAGPAKPLVGPQQPMPALVRAFQSSPRVFGNLAPIVHIFPHFREIRGMHLATMVGHVIRYIKSV